MCVKQELTHPQNLNRSPEQGTPNPGRVRILQLQNIYATKLLILLIDHPPPQKNTSMCRTYQLNLKRPSEVQVTQHAFPTAAEHSGVDQVTEQGGTVLPQISWHLFKTNTIPALPLEKRNHTDSMGISTAYL